MTNCAKTPNNRGRTLASGVIAGACEVLQVFQMLKSGRVPQLEETWRSAVSLQGSGDPSVLLWWCLGALQGRKRRRVYFGTQLGDGLALRANLKPSERFPWKDETWPRSALSGDRSAFGSEMVTDTRGV